MIFMVKVLFFVEPIFFVNLFTKKKLKLKILFRVCVCLWSFALWSIVLVCDRFENVVYLIGEIIVILEIKTHFNDKKKYTHINGKVGNLLVREDNGFCKFLSSLLLWKR